MSSPKHIVCLSGGHSSALVAFEVARRYGRTGVVLLNHDIHPRVEDADIKRFKREVAEVTGIPLTQADHPECRVKDQFDICVEENAFKTVRGNVLCTTRLKTEPFAAWLAEHAPPGTATVYYGFDKGETTRIQRRSTSLAEMGYRSEYPLAHWERTIFSTREVGIEPPLTYTVWKHGNCTGCIRAGRQHWFVVYATRPDVWTRAKDAEEAIGYTIINGVSLSELEPLFAEMVRAGVVPTERVPSQGFWADAKRRVRSLPVLAEDSALPCECIV